jgi:hypothetical protein
MNYKKGLVALAITGALATPIAASAATKFVTHGGQGATAAQVGPQTGVALSPIYGLNITNAAVNDDVTIDQILAGMAVDFDADTNPATNGSFVGSMRRDVSIAYTADVEIPNEANYTFTFHNGDGSTAPEAGLSVSDISNLRLVAQVAVGNGTVAANDFVEVGKIVNYIPSVVDADIVSQFVIQIDTNVSRLLGVQFFGAGNNPGVTPAVSDILGAPHQLADPLPAGIQLYLTSTAVSATGAYNPVTMELADTAVKGDEAHLAITEVKSSANVVLDALFANADSHVLTVTDGFELTVVDQATNTIEVETDRTSFADCETWDETVTSTGASAFADYVCASDGARVISRAKLSFASSADVGLDVRNTNTMEFTVSRKDKESLSGVDSVDFGATATTLNTTTETFSGSGSLLNIGLMDSLNNNLEADLDITADGVDPLFPNAGDAADWVLSNVVIKAGGGLTQDVNVPVVYGETTTVLSGITYNRADSNSVAVDGVTHVWGIDGALFKTPYLYSLPNANGWGSVVKVTNEFSADAGIQADIIIAPAGEGAGTDAGMNTPAVGNTFVGVKLPMMVPANGQYTFNGTDLINAINTQFGAGTVDATANWHIEATFLVNAPQNYVHAAAQNKSPDGRADSPVLYKTNNGNDGRQWQ